MLNPEFRLLEPEAEQLERLRSLAGPLLNTLDWNEPFLTMDRQLLKTILAQSLTELSLPGIQTQAAIISSLRKHANANGVYIPECGYFGWPEKIIERWLSSLQAPTSVALGILDAEGTWLGIVAGVSRGGLDFLSTFRYFWTDDPELAARQTIDDVAGFCKNLEQRFNRPAKGLYIFKNEFLEWRDSDWSGEKLAFFVEQHTAVKIGW